MLCMMGKGYSGKGPTRQVNIYSGEVLAHINMQSSFKNKIKTITCYFLDLNYFQRGNDRNIVLGL